MDQGADERKTLSCYLCGADVSSSGLVGPMNVRTKTSKMISMRMLLGLGVACFVRTLSASESIAITQVSASAFAFDAQNEKLEIAFSINEPSSASITVYDANDVAVRKLIDRVDVSPGKHVYYWDGRDDFGKPVSSEAYSYTVSASRGTETVTYDVSDTTGGQTVPVSDIEYDRSAGVVSFTVSKPSRVFLRIGVKHGFLMKTLVNNEPFLPGKHTVAWDGLDRSGVLSLSDHPQ